MDLCSSGHDEIVHDERNCPLCVAKNEIADLTSQVEGLQEELKEAQQ